MNEIISNNDFNCITSNTAIDLNVIFCFTAITTFISDQHGKYDNQIDKNFDICLRLRLFKYNGLYEYKSFKAIMRFGNRVLLTTPDNIEAIGLALKTLLSTAQSPKYFIETDNQWFFLKDTISGNTNTLVEDLCGKAAGADMKTDFSIKNGPNYTFYNYLVSIRSCCHNSYYTSHEYDKYYINFQERKYLGKA